MFWGSHISNSTFPDRINWLGEVNLITYQENYIYSSYGFMIEKISHYLLKEENDQTLLSYNILIFHGCSTSGLN